MKQRIAVLSLFVLLAAGCSQTNDYVARAGASGEDIFRNACFECHRPKEGGHYFELGPDMAGTDAIAKKITEGGLVMPAFPKISGEELQRLSEYVLAQSKME